MAVWRLPIERPELPAALEQAVLPSVLAAACVTVPQLRRRVRRAVLVLDPAAAEQRHQRALADRRVEYQPGEDGMAALTALLPAAEAQLIYTRLTAAAALLPAEDHHTLDQRRADALLDISPHRYRTAQRVRDYLSARDDVCAFATCNQPGYRCEPDHTIPYAQGGPTLRDNLALTCRRHNQAKAGTGWTYRHNPTAATPGPRSPVHRPSNPALAK